MYQKRLGIVVIVGFAILATLGVVLTARGRGLIVKAYFTNAMGLHLGATVRMAGVDIGSVKSVRVRPEAKDQPVEVVMLLNPSYELKIPNDSIAQLETAGVLGATYVNIDAASAFGPPIGPNAVLKSKPTAQLTTEEVLGKLGEVLGKVRCDCDDKKDNPSAVGKKPPSKMPSH